MCSKNKKMWTLPQMILRSCNPAIMRSCNPAILNKISISAIIYSHHNKPNPKLRKYLYKNTKEIPKLVLFLRSHVRRSCNPAIRSGALHHKSSASSQSSAIIQQTWTTKWRKHTYKQAEEIPKLVLFRRSHVRRSCNPAIRSGALHRTDIGQTDNGHSHMLFLVPDPWSRTQ